MRAPGQAAGFFQLRLSDARLFRRRIAKPVIPGGGPEDAEDAEDIERGSPAVAHLDGDDQQRGNRATNLRGRQHDAKSATTLRYRKPPGHDGRGIGKGARFTRAEEETGDEERVVA